VYNAQHCTQMKQSAWLGDNSKLLYHKNIGADIPYAPPVGKGRSIWRERFAFLVDISKPGRKGQVLFVRGPLEKLTNALARTRAPELQERMTCLLTKKGKTRLYHL